MVGEPDATMQPTPHDIQLMSKHRVLSLKPQLRLEWRAQEGTVKTVNWSNPHITFVIEADARNGEAATSWVFEVSSPGVLTRSGWTKRSLQPGDHAVFYYAPLRDGTLGGFLMKSRDRCFGQKNS
jgi:hypothetical protein